MSVPNRAVVQSGGLGVCARSASWWVERTVGRTMLGLFLVPPSSAGVILGVSSDSSADCGGTSSHVDDWGALTSGASRSVDVIMVDSAGTRVGAYHRLLVADIDRYRTLAAHHPVSEWLGFGGGLAWTTAANAGRMREWHRGESDRGVRELPTRAKRGSRRVSGVDQDAVRRVVRRGIRAEDWVDLPSLVRLLVGKIVARRRAGHRGRQLLGLGGVCLGELGGAGHRRCGTGDGRRPGDDHPRRHTIVSLLVATRLGLMPDRRAGHPRVAPRRGPGGTRWVDSAWATEEFAADEAGGYTLPDDVVPR
jgi:hypothetical protein